MTQDWRLLCLEKLEPLLAQTFYEAVALAIDRGHSRNTLIVCQPASPYVCLGFHQDLEREIDVEYCRRNGLPIIRRSQGGGATYLNSDQVFYQLVVHKTDPVLPSNVDELFEKILAAPIHTYRKLGLNAQFKPVNDITVGGRKISGNGAGLIGSAVVLVGNIILDLDYDSMSQVLRVPDEKFRDKLATSMMEWVTSLKRELGYVPEAQAIYELLAKEFSMVLGIDLTGDLPTEEEKLIWNSEVRPKHLSAEWLRMSPTQSFHRDWRAIKVANEVNIAEVDHKAGKLIRVRAELVGGRIKDIMITGDFFILPEQAIGLLEERLVGAMLEEKDLRKRIQSFFKNGDVQMPGVEGRDLIDAVMKLREALP